MTRIRSLGSVLSILLLTAGAHAASPAPAKDAKDGKDGKGWHPPGCPAPAGGPKQQSKIKVGGPCEADWNVDADCENEIDDLTFTSRRKVKDGVEMVVYINVERYAGAGNYKPPNDIYVSVMKGKTIWRWSANDFEATIGPGSRNVTVNNVKLEPELLLIGCTGPQTNYQCDGRDDDAKHMASITTVSGTLFCKSGSKIKPR